MSNKKLRSLSDSEDGNPDYSVDSSDDEILLPLETILAQSAKPTKNPEPLSDEDGTQDMIPSHNNLVSVYSFYLRGLLLVSNVNVLGRPVWYSRDERYPGCSRL